MKSDIQLQWLSSLILLGVAMRGASCFDYCNASCRTRTQTYKHTMCLYPELTIGANCKRFDFSKELGKVDKETLLKVHNQLRSKVATGKESRGSPGPQPPAANMMELVWDDELEAIARRWAYQCDYNHDKCKKTKTREQVGQNLAVSSASSGFKNDLETMVTQWYNEVEFTPNRVANGFSSSAGKDGETISHYTQLVWGETTRVGCGRVYFDYSDWGMTEYLVCNYAKGGNMLKAPVYKVGKSCSACSGALKCSSKYPGLCTSGESEGTPETDDSVSPSDYDGMSAEDSSRKHWNGAQGKSRRPIGFECGPGLCTSGEAEGTPETDDSVSPSDYDGMSAEDSSRKHWNGAQVGGGMVELVVSSILAVLLVNIFQ